MSQTFGWAGWVGRFSSSCCRRDSWNNLAPWLQLFSTHFKILFLAEISLILEDFHNIAVLHLFPSGKWKEVKFESVHDIRLQLAEQGVLKTVNLCEWKCLTTICNISLDGWVANSNVLCAMCFAICDIWTNLCIFWRVELRSTHLAGATITCQMRTTINGKTMAFRWTGKWTWWWLKR